MSMLYWTPADQAAGFPALTARLEALDDAALSRCYLEGMRDCLGGMFAHNARVLQR